MGLTKLNFSGSGQGAVTNSLPTGSIVKTEFAEIDTFGRTSLSTSSNTDIPGTEKSFTRVFSDSKILVHLNIRWNTYLYGLMYMNRKIGSGSYAQINLGATGTQGGVTSSGGVLANHYNNTSANAMGYGLHSELYAFLDNPGTSTDAITYKISAFSYNATGVFGLNTNASYNSASGYHTTKCGYTFYEIKQ
tara:strand:- start:398 stop:970 length:573 start_codon:yes stop_codon:yes gene_type:complete